MFNMQYGILVIALFIPEPVPRVSHFIFHMPPFLIEEPYQLERPSASGCPGKSAVLIQISDHSRGFKDAMRVLPEL